MIGIMVYLAMILIPHIVCYYFLRAFGSSESELIKVLLHPQKNVHGRSVGTEFAWIQLSG